jgi:ketosteroid isomerase-like protein
MSSENVEIVRAVFPGSSIDFVELWNAGIPDEVWANFEPDFEVEFVSKTPDLETPKFRGASGIEEGWRDWLEPWESYRGHVEDVIDAGDEVIVTARVEARARRGGVLFEHPAAVVMTLRERKIARVRFYLDREDAFRDVGVAS